MAQTRLVTHRPSVAVAISSPSIKEVQSIGQGFCGPKNLSVLYYQVMKYFVATVEVLHTIKSLVIFYWTTPTSEPLSDDQPWLDS